MAIDAHASAAFLLVLAVLVMVAKGAGAFAVRLHQPAVLGELLAGVLLGPSALNFLHWHEVASPHLEPAILFIASLGVSLLMFFAGLETDLAELRRVGKVAISAGVSGVIVPVALCAGVAVWFGYPAGQSLFLGVVLSATSVSITVQTLMELDRFRTREGVTLLGAAVADDILAILALSLLIALGSSAGPLATGWALVRMALFFAIAWMGGSLIVNRVLPRAEQLPISEAVLAIVLSVTLLFAWAAEALGGLAAITGAYLVGVLVARGPLVRLVHDRLQPFVQAFLVPIFFVSIGLQTNILSLSAADLGFAVVLTAAAIVSKILGSGGAALLLGEPRRFALRIGFGMVSRGEVGLILAGLGLATGSITQAQFGVVVLVVIVTTLVTPVLIRWSFATRDEAGGVALKGRNGL